MLNKLKKWLHLKWLGKDGPVKRGRKGPEHRRNLMLSKETQVDFGIGGVGGSVIRTKTCLIARHLRKNPKTGKYEEIDRRVEYNRKVTTAFVNFIVDQLIAESSIFGDFKYHDSGTGVVAENPSDVGLGTPCGEARTIGSQEEGSQTYEYKSIATHTYAGTFDITEHGLFNASSGVTLMDRTVFSAIGVTSGDKIEFTFTIQFSAEA